MATQKKPVAVLKAQGSRHYTKEELADREAREIKAPTADVIKPPKTLPKHLRKDFRQLAPVLIQMGVLGSVDGDALARYLIARDQYNMATDHLAVYLHSQYPSIEVIEKWSSVQDKYYKQCRASAQDLGLTISARANLVLPNGAPEQMSQEEADMFGG